ncbi:MAG: helix-turn-helix domain-containing protein [Acidobacteria bacterium]|nr:helix-turn-helix domain-containing protein [Acidobacteriota bacterium]
MAIADHADDRGAHAFPSVPTLARMAGVSSREVVRALKRLERAGLLVISRRAGRRQANVYRLAMVTPGHDETTEIVTGGHRDSDRWSPPMVTGGHLIRSSDPISDPEREGERIEPALASGPPSPVSARQAVMNIELLRRRGISNAALGEALRVAGTGLFGKHDEDDAVAQLLAVLAGTIVERIVSTPRDHVLEGRP